MAEPKSLFHALPRVQVWRWSCGWSARFGRLLLIVQTRSYFAFGIVHRRHARFEWLP